MPRHQADALAQRLFKIQRAVHRPGSDFLYPVAHADRVGQFVDAFLPDHGAVHVGQQHFLAPPACRLHHQIKAKRLQILPDLPTIIGDHVQVEFSRFARRQPARLAPAPGIAQGLDGGGVQIAAARMGDQRGDKHRRAFRVVFRRQNGA